MTDPDMRDPAIPFFIDWGDTPHPSSQTTPAAELAELQVLYADPRLHRAVAMLTPPGQTHFVKNMTGALKAQLVLPNGHIVVLA
ncbi:MAG: hypothetical protein AAF311_02235 [Pseudomonadota bacterium]